MSLKIVKNVFVRQRRALVQECLKLKMAKPELGLSVIKRQPEVQKEAVEMEMEATK
jgi:hypothetical protein